MSTATPLMDDELRDVKALAERYKHQRGAQGRWARLWLRLYANLQDSEGARRIAEYESAEHG